VIGEKNGALFRHTGGYQPPGPDHADTLLGTGILLALRDQCDGAPCRAIGEKTPENIFFFPRLKRIFSGAKLIAIARDPRDVLTSAWHFFRAGAARREAAGDSCLAEKTEFIRTALPSIAEGARTLLAHAAAYRGDCAIVTYERLHEDPAQTLPPLLRFLGVADTADIVTACIERTSFAALTAAQAGGDFPGAAFLRKGQVGDWTTTLTPELNDMILRQLGWIYPRFGWRP
jgi:hypothetical protein